MFKTIFVPVFSSGLFRGIFPDFSPIDLFSTGSQGIWLDPSDLTTMFQDRAGSTPVTAPGQSVGLRLDKSGNNNHALAIDDAARGIYGVEPFGGRRNLLTFTEQFDNAAWVKTAVTVAANSSAAPDGTATADTIVPTAANVIHDIRSGANSSLPASACVLTAYVKAAGYNFVEIGISSDNVFTAYSTAAIDLTNGTNAGTGVNLTWTTNSVSVQNVGGGWYRVSLAFTPNLATTTAMVFVGAYPTSSRGVSFTGDGTSGILIWGAQLETGSTATAYQRVTDQYNVTEAGQPTLHYVQYNDDGYVTPTITPGIDKAQVFAGVRKLSDAAIGMLMEFSSITNANPGSFAVLAPVVPGSPDYLMHLQGSVGAAYKATSYAAPITNVLSVLYDIAGATIVDEIKPRINGLVPTISTSPAGPAGTGNFLAYPLYIGRRGGTTLPFNGRDYGIITRFGPNLSAQHILQVERYVGEKTGLNL